MKTLLFAALLVLAAAAGSAAPLQRDLGQGLSYWRARELPADLPPRSFAVNRPCVLDLRFARGNAAAGAVLLAWLKFHAGPRATIFLLANAATSPELLDPLDSPDAVTGLLIIGPSAPDFTPDIALNVPPAEDRRAYDALDHGASLESLTVQKVDKPRIDEQKLTEEHLSDSEAGDDDAAAEEAKPVEKAAAPPQIIDRVLQRAVQLDRAMLALKRI